MCSTYEKGGRFKEMEIATRKKNLISIHIMRKSFLENIRYIKCKRNNRKTTTNSGIHCSARTKRYVIWSAFISRLKRHEIVKTVISQVLKGNPTSKIRNAFTHFLVRKFDPFTLMHLTKSCIFWSSVVKLAKRFGRGFRNTVFILF